jgi:ABC-type dipeptide/oligopeptide/nickel transport system permease component
MGRYLLRRLGFAVLLVFVVSSAALLLTRIAPGDFAAMQGVDLSRDEREHLRESLGLNRSLPEQYVSWLGGIARFDFGQSLLYSRPVSALIGERAINTAVLATFALLLATFVGIPLGIYTGTQTGLVRSLVRAISLVGISVPPLVGSLALVFLAARTGWFPVGGMTSPTGIDSPGRNGSPTSRDIFHCPRLPWRFRWRRRSSGCNRKRLNPHRASVSSPPAARAASPASDPSFATRGRSRSGRSSACTA